MPTSPTPAGLLVRDAATGGRPRWLLSLGLGLVLCLAVFFLSNVGPQIVLDRALVGMDYALVGLLQVALVPLAVWLARRPAAAHSARITPRIVGWYSQK